MGKLSNTINDLPEQMRLLAEQAVRITNIFYNASSDANGARVVTSLDGTICPTCKASVTANVEHRCGNRVKSKKPKRRRPPR